LNGNWTLEIKDTTGNKPDTQLNSWSLYICTSPTVSQIEVAELPDGLRDLDVTVTLGDDPANPYDFDLADYSLVVRKLDAAGTVLLSKTLFSSDTLAGSALGNVVLGTTFDDEAAMAFWQREYEPG